MIILAFILSFAQPETKEVFIFKDCIYCELYINGEEILGKQVSFTKEFKVGQSVDIKIINRWYGKTYRAGILSTKQKVLVGNGIDYKQIVIK